MAQQTPESLLLPVANQDLGKDGQVQTYTFTITKDTYVRDLKPILKGLGLPKSGNKDVLIKRLRDFSNDQESWQGLFKPAAKRQRGDATGSRAKNLSAQRTQALFHTEAMAQNVHPSRYGKDTRPITAQSVATHESDRDWVSEVLGMSTEVSESSGVVSSTTDITEEQHDSMEARSGHQGQLHVADSELKTALNKNTIEMHRMSTTLGKSTYQISRIADTLIQLSTMRVASHSLSPPQASSTLVAECANVHGIIVSPETTKLDNTRTSDRRTNHTSACQATTNGQDINVKNRCRIYLGEEELTFDKTTVPPPPMQHFSRNLTTLFREWEKSDLLVINGRGIAVKYWSEVYKKRTGVPVAQDGAWNALKVTWGNWKFIVEEKNRLGGEETFWKTYTHEDGSNMTYQQILDSLKNARQLNDQRDATAARLYFKGDLDCPQANGVFAYSKGRQRFVCEKDSKIAEVWRNLVKSNPTIQDRVERGLQVDEDEGEGR